MNIWFATNNTHKKSELEAILNTSLKIPSEEGLNFNPDETGVTFYDNALLKARELKKLLDKHAFKSGDIVIADDSGLCVDALNGRPGIFSARYGEEDGKKLSSGQKNLLLLEELGDTLNRKARFVCAMTLLLDENKFFIVQETLEGEIVKNNSLIRGDGGFGYDPIFYLPQKDATLAEISPEEKNRLSHRGKAGILIANLIKGISTYS